MNYRKHILLFIISPVAFACFLWVCSILCFGFGFAIPAAYVLELGYSGLGAFVITVCFHVVMALVSWPLYSSYRNLSHDMKKKVGDLMPFYSVIVYGSLVIYLLFIK